MSNYFLWGRDVERAVKQVREHAEKRENWYRPGVTAQPPGDDAFFVVRSGTLKAVFSWTVMPYSSNPRHPPAGSLLRHLTVSVRGEGRYPRPDILWTLAHHFGFTGATPNEGGHCTEPGPEWIVGQDEGDQCAIIQQLVPGLKDAPPFSIAQ